MNNNVDNVTRKRYDLDRVTRLVIAVVCIWGTIYVVNYLSPVLLPFLVGCVLAYMLNPMVERMQRLLHCKSRGVPAVVTVIIAFGVIAAVLWLLIPYIATEVSDMTNTLTAYAKAQFQVPHLPVAVREFLHRSVDPHKLSSILSHDQWDKLANKLLTGTWTVVDSTMSAIISIASWLIALLYMFFVLIDYDKISRGFKGAIPRQYRKLSLKVLRDVEVTMNRYFRGQALVSLCVGVIFAIEFSIIGLPMAIAFGLLIGVLNMVPYLQLISMPVAAFLCLVEAVATGGSFWSMLGWTFGAYCLCQLIQDMVLTPHIMRQQMGLRPAIIFLSLSIWGYVLGFIGLIIALPLTTLIFSYYKEYVLHQPASLPVAAALAQPTPPPYKPAADAMNHQQKSEN